MSQFSLKPTLVVDVFECVAVAGEASEPFSVEIDSQRVVVHDKHVDAQIELLASQQQWTVDVPLHNIRFCQHKSSDYCRVVGLPTGITSPVRDTRQFIEDEDALALRLGDGLGDPQPVRVLGKLFLEDWVVCRQVVSLWNEVNPRLRNPATPPPLLACCPAPTAACTS